MSADENLWYVKTADGDVHRVTLDQLDDAFQAGRIDENVMVLAAGATTWAKLGDLLGGEDATPPAPPAYSPAPAYAPAPRAVSPYAAGPYTPAGALAPMVSSLRPVSMDLSLDDNAFKKKSHKGVAIGVAVGVLAILGGVLAANRAHINLLGGSSTTAVAAAPAPAPAPPPPATADTPAPAPAPAPSPVASTAPSDSSASKLNDEQKAKIAAADKALELKSKNRKKGRAAAGGVATHGPAKRSGSQGFTTGGNKFDPLNASM
jgi:hypothetical protein